MLQVPTNNGAMTHEQWCVFVLTGFTFSSTHIHKVFRDIAQRNKHSTGWFFSCKQYLICNKKEELLDFMLTSGDVDEPH
ncbi:MAG: hypothetical protein GXY64_11585 [Bacteroidales bacterium]|nr:hypothetical protein [Bacteroidales bacterium]